MSPTVKAHIALFFVALIYGANYTIAKEVLDQDYIQPLGFILLRVVSGMLLFWAIHLLWIREKTDRKDIWLLFLCGLFGVAINQMFFFSGLKFTRPINASLIMTTTPILVLIASSLLIRERITTNKVIGILAGMGGAILLIGYGKEVVYRPEQALGDLMVFINASSFGIYLVLVGKLMRKYHPITVVKWVFTFGFLAVLPFGYGQLSSVNWNSFPPGIWAAVVYVLLCTTFLTYLFNAYALKRVQPTVVSSYIYLQPLLAGLIALLFGKDELTGIKLLAAILIFFGVYLVSQRRPKTEDA